MTSIAPILIVGDVGDCWEAYVAGGLKRIPKELVLASDPTTEEAARCERLAKESTPSCRVSALTN